MDHDRNRNRDDRYDRSYGARDNRPHGDRYYSRLNRDRDDRSFFDRAASKVESWFDDDDDREGRTRYGRHYDNDRSDMRGGRGHEAGYVTRTAFGDDDDYDERTARSRPYRGGTDDRDDDRSHYRSWRDRQVASLDRDYDEYRREREEDFHSEFDDWRGRRRQQRGHMRQARAGQEVLCRDGNALGTVERVTGDRIYLTAEGDAAHGRRHSVPVRWIDSVDDKVRINKSQTEATSAWHRETDRDGDWFGDSVDSDPDATNRAGTTANR